MKTKTVFIKKWLLVAFVTVFCLLTAIGGFLLAMPTRTASAAETGMTYGTEYTYAARKTSAEPIRTFEATVNVTNPGNNYGGVILGNYHSNGSMGFRFEIGENDATVDNGYPTLYVKDNANIEHTFAFTDAGVFGLGKAHVAVVLDDNAAKCYINGELKQSIDYTGATPFMPLVTVGNSIQLGTDGELNSLWRRFRGQIFDAALYTDVRTSSEIAEDRNGASGENLLLSYEVTSADNSATTIADKSGNGFDLVKQVQWIDPADKAAVSDYDYSFAIVGDPQIMNAKYAASFNGIFSWINNNTESKKINQVMVMGDLVDTNDAATEEWQRGQAALNGLTVPYNLIRGNHDGFLSNQSTATFDTYFGSSTKYGQSVTGYYAAGGTYANAYRTFEVSGVPYLVMMLDYGPSDAVLEWAGSVISENSDRNVIVMTHSYLSKNGTTEHPGNTNPPSSVTYGNDGTEIWNELIRKHENIVMVLSGHEGADQVVMTQRQGDNGNTVTEFLIDPQELDNRTEGGTGMVTMMYFSDNGRTVQLETYSTVKNQYYLATNQFSFELDASTPEMPELLNGASVRYDSKSGIRFSAYVKDEIANASGYTYGFLLAQNKTKTYSIDELTAENAEQENSGIAKLISRTWALDTDKNNKAGYKLYNAVITGLPEDVYGTEFVARAFVMDASGNYYYSDAISTRSMAEVANAALSDATFMETAASGKATLENYVMGSFTLNASSLTFAEIGDVQKLTATCTGANAPVAYASNNTAVVTVDSDGTVKAVGAGTATVTAYMGAKTQTVSVTVGGSTGTAVTKFIRTVDDFYSIMNATSGYYVLENDLYLGTYKPGDVVYEKDYTTSYQFHPSVSFGGTLDGNGYTIHYSHISQHSVYLFQTMSGTVKDLNINVSYYNGSTAYVRAAALAYSNTGIIENVYVNALVPTPGQNGAIYERFAKAGLVMNNSGTIRNCVVNMTYTGGTAEYLHGIAVTNAGTITDTAFISDNTSIKTVYSGGTGDNVKTYNSVEAFVSGYDSFVSSGYTGTNYPTAKIELADIDYEYFAGSATDLTIGGISGTVSEVKLGGEVVSYTAGSGSITIASSLMEGKNGKVEFVITTNTGVYTVIANALKKQLITTAEQFKAIVNDMSAYYVLGNDVNLGKFNDTFGWTANNADGTPFTGTLDGNGYTLTYNAGWTSAKSNHNQTLFQTIGATGTVKNVKIHFTAGTEGTHAYSGAVAYSNYGTIENVYAVTVDTTGGNFSGSTGGLHGFVSRNYGTINNSVAEMQVSVTTYVFGIAGSNTGTVSNTAAITTATANFQSDTGTSLDNVQTYASVDAFASGLATFKANGYTGTLYPVPTVSLGSVAYVLDANNTESLTIGGISGAVVSVKRGGTSFDFTDNGDSVTVSASSMATLSAGANEIIVRTATNAYSVTVNVTVVQYISTAEEFKAIANDTTGYYKLNADIDLGTFAASTTVAATFSGTLDGNGYTVSYTSSGHYVQLFGTIAAGGTVKNMNLVVDTTAHGGNPAANYALTKTNNGTIENVYSKVTFKNKGNADASTDYSSGGLVAVNNGTINNVVVELVPSASTLTGWHGVAYNNGANGKITNSAVITNGLTAVTAVNYKGDTGNTTTNTLLFANVEAFDYDLGDFQSAGYTGTNYPVFTIIEISTAEEFTAIPSGSTGYYKLTADINLGAYNVGQSVNFAGTLDGNGHTITYTTGAAHDKALFGTMSGTVKNVIVKVSTYAGNQVDIAAICKTNAGHIENVYVDYTASVPGQNASHKDYSKAGMVMENKGTIKNSVVVVRYTGTTAIDSKLLAICAANSGTVSNTAVITIVDNASAGTIPAGATGTNVVTYTSVEEFEDNFATFQNAGYTGTNYPKSDIIRISTAKEFTSIASGSTGKYKLTNNIDLGAYNTGTGVNFAGVLDGNGYMITYSTGAAHDKALFGTMSGTVKNLAVTINVYNGNQCRIAAIAKENTGTIENVYITYSAGTAGQGGNETYAKAGIVISNKGTINNAVIVMNYTGASSANILGFCSVNYAGATISNAALINLGTAVSEQTTNNGTKTNIKSYTTTQAFIDDLANFQSAGYTGTMNPSNYTVIVTVAQFQAIASNMAGHYVLGTNLTIYDGTYGTSANNRWLKPLGYVQSNTNPGTNVPFTGTLDGNGYTLTYNYAWGGPGSNNHDKSLFYIIGETGVIKNLGLNVTEGVGDSTARSAALAWINNGTIENVYTKIKFTHNASGQNLAYGSAGLVANNYGKINNCIVNFTDTTTSGTAVAAVVGVNNAGATITNTVAIVTSSNSGTVYQYTNNGTKTNTPIYTSYADFYAAKDSFISGGFVEGAFWTIDESAITFG